MFDFQQYVAKHKNTRYANVILQNYAFSEDMQRLRRMMDTPLLPQVFERGLQAWSLTEKLHLKHVSKDISIEPRSARLWQSVCAEMDVGMREARIIPGQKALCEPYGHGSDVFVGLSPACCMLPTTSLRFVLGQAIGALSNGHAPYMTLSHFADKLTRGLYGRATTIADALLHWQQSAHITQDRAGLLASRDLSAAIFMIMKTSLDWPDDEIMIEIRRYHAHSDVDFGEKSVEIRVRALEIFAKSALYAQACGLPDDGLMTMTEVDEAVHNIL